MFTRSVGLTGAVLAAALLSMPLEGMAGPRVLQETAKLTSPDPDYRFPGDIAVDGDWLIATGVKFLNPDDIGDQDHSAWLFQRQSDGTWAVVRRLVQYIYYSDLDEPPMTVDMQGGVAAIMLEGSSWIFERNGANWVSVPSPITTDGMDIAVNGGTILATQGYCAWAANAYRKNGSGAWELVRSTEPQPDEFCENEDDRGSVDVSGNANIVYTWGNELFSRGSARIFEGPYGMANTPVMTRLLAPPDTLSDLGDPVAIDLPSALVGGEPNGGTYVFTRDSSGTWSLTERLVRPDALSLGYSGRGADIRNGLAVLSAPLDRTYGEHSGSVSVFQRNADNTFKYAARLMASDRRADQAFGNSDISGQRIAVGAAGGVYIFDLPTDLTQPATVQDGFEDGNASDWTPLAGSSFSVVPSGSRVYRQTTTAGNSASIWGNTDRTNQSVEADIKPTAYATTTGDKWFGVVARYTDANNYYYVTLRNNNTVLLRRMVDGVFTTLDSAALPIALNRTYRVRLEAIGTRLRLFVDNQLLAEADDSSLSHGQAGVMMYKMRADYDNILVSANPQTPLVTYQFPGDDDSRDNWETLGAWTQANGVYAQSDLVSGTRAITGVTTGDQVVQARIRRTSSAGTNNWFGLATRYRDAGNYYYFTLRNDNTISLRKLVNNAIVELDSAPFTVAGNTWYRARFEAVGTQLRVYMNDVLLLEATDTSHATGRYGPVMYRAGTEYDDILAVEP